MQRLSTNGGLLWGNAGISLKPTSSSPQYGNFAAAKTDGGVVLVYAESPSFGNDVMNALSVDAAGTVEWTASVSSTPSSKSRTDALGVGGGIVLAWQDDRSGSNDIYGQRINGDGSLGSGESCSEDLNGDGLVGVSDLLQVIDAWGACGMVCAEDLDNDGAVGVSDLLMMIDAWGDC